MRWLEKEACGKNLCFYVIICLIIDFMYCFSILELFNLLKINPPTSKEKIPINLIFPLILFGSAFFEELIFRAPLIGVIKMGWPKYKIIISATIFSAAFGMCHGSIYNIFIQGVSGFMYCVLFLKCGGIQKKYNKALITTTTAHFSFNGILAIITLAKGVTTF